jgi:spermidine synthase
MKTHKEVSSPDDGDVAGEATSTSAPGKENSMRSIYAGIFLTSAGVLLLQISLTRIFSYTIWYHFTYVTISLAMLGFGASGAVLASSEKLGALDLALTRRTSLIGAISVPIMLTIVSKVPFYPFQLLTEPIQFLYMVLYYVAVTLPFFCAGMTISCAFRSLPQKASRIYFWDLLGAGTGCLFVVAAINLFGVPGVAALSGTFFLLACAMFFGPKSKKWKLVIVAAAILWVPTGASIETVLKYKASKEKWMARTSNKEITFSKWSPIFRVDAYEFPKGKGPLGIIKELYGIARKNIPAHTENAYIAHDGDACTMMIKSVEDGSTWKMFDKSVLKSPYLIKENPKALIIGPGGGVDVIVALQSKARSVLAVELDPITVDLVSNKYADFVGHLYSRPEVDVVVDEGRSFLRRSEEKYDLIQMTGVDTLAALTSGAYVLSENYLYTTEAYIEFMDHLNPDGLLSVAVFDFHHRHAGLFPRQVTKLVSLSVESLTAMGIQKPQNHIAVIGTNPRSGSIPLVVVLTKKDHPFTLSDIRSLREFTKELSFEIWYAPGAPPDNPCAYIATATEEMRMQYYQDHLFKLTAPTDDSPFFYHSGKWSRLIETLQLDTGHTGTTGQLILLLILFFSVLFSVILIIFPLFKFRRTGLQTRWKWNYIFYFAALGLGFIFIEISYIQRFILFLGYPTYSLTVILFALLTFSGVGSYLSGRLPFSLRKILIVALALLAAVTLGYIVVLPPIFDHFLGASRQIRIAISLVLLFPLGLLLGIFFPTGIKIISADDRRFVPWAWGINGCASVIGTILSIIIAMSHGFRTVTILAIIIYAIGIFAMVRAIGTTNSENT